MKTCTLCSSPDRQKIEQALVNGASLRGIAATFETSPTTLRRHKKHISTSLAAASAAKELALGTDLLVDIQAVMQKARELLQAAEKTGDLRTALMGVREIARLLELRGRADGSLTEKDLGRPTQPMFVLPMGTTVNVTISQAAADSKSAGNSPIDIEAEVVAV